MSATIYWKPISPASGTVPASAPSSFMEAMREAFGDRHQWTLGPDDIPTLRGMAAACGTYKGHDNPYHFIIKKIENGDEGRNIQIWAEY